MTKENKLENVCKSCSDSNFPHQNAYSGKTKRPICGYPYEAQYKDHNQTVFVGNGSSIRGNLCCYKSR